MFSPKTVFVWIGVVLLSGMFLMGQVGWNEPPPPEEVTVSILVQVDPRYPIEFDGMMAGDPVPDAEVQITDNGEVVASGFTNSGGEVVFELLERESYVVDVVADTSEPDCWWKEHSSFHLTGPIDIAANVWTEGLGCAAPPVEVSLLVRVNPLFPYDDFGLMPGDPVPYAEVEITNRITHALVASGTTDGNGEIILEVPGISVNYIHVTADTVDPFCMWFAGVEAIVGTEPLEVTVDMWVGCA